jgi:hypothetical protein
MKKQKQKNKKTKKQKKISGNTSLIFFQENYHLLRWVFRTRPRPRGTKSLLYIIARNKRDCFLAFFKVVHLEKTRFVFLFNTE